ncbi:type II toxin-antitoxin system mRNA interferase toxin, RelE/StbE family [Mixta theicola]|uniref:Type II toxin-antitoxin system mRNA interferase toxin, RelE/StbE family n=1 Tax=Mixta theicola TaxID=1458355 RepID=A0A2K1QCD1_9GAMM|nr:type II toxin-antitoxin system RelE/ParE family toxin [Mixta theicola]PNS12685.1 type II toxin-antitoxin system mRNA interferase toxin, RelE/StbE family [Mixta theicola]
MTLIWTEPARDDRRAIREYIALDNPVAAVELDEQLSARASQLIEQPESGRPGRVAGTRELVVHRHYVIIYEVVAATVYILRVLHTSRRWP